MKTAGIPPIRRRVFLLCTLFGLAAIGLLAWKSRHAPPPARPLHLWRTIPIHHRIDQVSFSGDGKQLILSFGDGSLETWNTNTWRRVKRIVPGEENQAISPGALLLATATVKHPNRVTIWNLRTGHRIRTWITRQAKAYPLAFSPDGALLAVTDDNGNIVIWDVKTSSQIQNWQHPDPDNRNWDLREALFSPDGRTLVTWSWYLSPILWDVRTGRKIRDLDDDSWTNAFALSSDGTKYAAGTHDLGAQVGKLGTGKIIYGVSVPNEWLLEDNVTYEIQNLAFSPDNKMLVTGDQHGLVQLWDAATGTKKYILQGLNFGCLACSPDSTILTTQDQNGNLALWQIPQQ